MESDPFVLSATEQGTVAISRDAVVEVVGRATAESYGVVALTGTSLVSRLIPWGVRKGIDLRQGDDGLVIEIRVVVERGLKLAEVSAAVRERVTYELQRMLGLPVASLEVHIERVRGR